MSTPRDSFYRKATGHNLIVVTYTGLSGGVLVGGGAGVGDQRPGGLIRRPAEELIKSGPLYCFPANNVAGDVAHSLSHGNIVHGGQLGCPKLVGGQGLEAVESSPFSQ